MILLNFIIMKKHFMLKKFEKSYLNTLDQPFFLFNEKKLIKQINLFKNYFNGKVLYAVKANPSEFIISILSKNGINSFDTASLKEIKLIRKILPNAEIFYMNPVKSRNSIKEALFRYDVKNFAVDSFDEVQKIIEVTNYSKDINFHLRIKIKNNLSVINLTKKFGAEKKNTIKLLKSLRKHSSRIGICFHVGSQCMCPNAFNEAMDSSRKIFQESKIEMSFLNIGGGFPSDYPGLNPIPLKNYFKIINKNFSNFSKHFPEIELLAEPGRSLVSESMSLVVKVELRKSKNLYINDGIYGHLNNAGLKNFNYPVRLFNRRDELTKLTPFSFFGPTCDSSDFIRGPFYLPDSVNEGDWIEIKQMGAYTTTMQSDFNGFYKKPIIFEV